MKDEALWSRNLSACLGDYQLPMDGFCNRFCDLNAVNGRGQDSSGIARSFARRVKSPDIDALQAFTISDDPDGRRCTRFRSGQYRIVQGKARYGPFKSGDGFPQGVDSVSGKCLTQIARSDSRFV